MSEPVDVGPLTSEERYLIALLRQGPQSVHGVAEALHLSADQAQDVLRRLDRKVGLVTLFRFGTLRYGLAE
jgi:hypothetical protein